MCWLSANLSTYLSVRPSIAGWLSSLYLIVCTTLTCICSVGLSAYFFSVFVFPLLPVCLSVYPVCLSACLSACLSVCLSRPATFNICRVGVCLFLLNLSISVCLSVCLPACLTDRLPVCLSFYLSVWLCTSALTPKALSIHRRTDRQIWLHINKAGDLKHFRFFFYLKFILSLS